MGAVTQTRLVRRLAHALLPVLGAPIAAVGVRLLRLTGRRAGVALLYHSLARQPGDPLRELVPPHGADLFEAQMRHLARTYRVVAASDLQQAAARRRRGERFPVAVTFDDDLGSHTGLAVPILQRTGLHATFFLTGASLQAPFSFWWERLQRVADADEPRLTRLFAELGADPSAATGQGSLHALGRLVERLEPEAREAFADSLTEPGGDPPDAGLDAAGVRALLGAGMSIGFHTLRHDPLPALDDRALAAAFRQGREELEEVVGERLRVVAYPHGRADGRVAAAARSAGFETGYTGYGNPVRPGDDPLFLGRIGPSYRSVGHFAVWIVAALVRARR